MTAIRKASSGIANARAAEADVAVRGRTLEGWASVFDAEYEIKGEYPHPEGFVEVVRKGAFRRALRTQRPVILWAHGRDTNGGIGNQPIAKLDEIKEDGSGLYYRATLFDVPQLALLKEGLAAGEVRGSSFRFAVEASGERWSKRGSTHVRELVEFSSVPELGPCTFPASPAASVMLRANRLLAGRAAAQAEVVAACRRMDGKRPSTGRSAAGEMRREAAKALVLDAERRMRALQLRGII